MLRVEIAYGDLETARKRLDDLMADYGIVDGWLRLTMRGTVSFWMLFPDSPPARLDPSFFQFIAPHPQEYEICGNKQAKRDYDRVVKVLEGPEPEISDAALWTALRFGGKPSGAIARDYLSASPSRDAAGLIAKAVSRFSKKIGLTLPDHSRCSHNDFLSAYRRARIASI